MKKQYEFVSKYYICEDCAFKKRYELLFDYVGTVTYGLCGHCKETSPKTLIPVVDFKRNNIKPIFD